MRVPNWSEGAKNDLQPASACLDHPPASERAVVGTTEQSEHRRISAGAVVVARNNETREASTSQLSAEMFNIFNFANVAFASAYDYPNNLAFIYGPGILPSGQTVGPNPGFLQLRTAQGAYNPATEVQQGTPSEFQLGLRWLF